MSRNFELSIEMKRKPSARAGAASADCQLPPARFADAIVSPCEQPMRELVQRVFLSLNGSAPRLVVFFGVDGASDSSRVCIAAARILASTAAKRVCLVDANTRSPRLSAAFGVERATRPAGQGGGAREMCLEVGRGLWLATLADPGGMQEELPSREQTHRLFRALAEQFDFLLIDAPDTKAGGEALELAAIADGSILVVQANLTRRLSARTAKDKCDAAGVKLLGTVLDNRTFPIPERLYRIC